MQGLKSIKPYFFSILKLFFLSFRKIYFKTNFYNKKLITFIPDRIFYNPSTYLSASLTTITSDFYKITNTKPKLLWETSVKEKQKFENFRKAKKAGVDILVSGTTIFKENGGNLKKNIQLLRSG